MFEEIFLFKDNFDVRRFFTFFLACSSISDNILFKFCDLLIENQSLQFLFSKKLNNFSLKRSYEINVLKRIINKLEKDDKYLPDFLYEKLCSLLSNTTTDKNFYRIFVCFKKNNFIVLHENNNQISDGTTGLSCWQAACVLSEFWNVNVISDHLLKYNIKIETLSLIELGSGCGLSGIAAGKSFKKFQNLMLTDLNDSVLKQLQKNIELNFDAFERKFIKVKRLDWLNYDLELIGLKSSPPNIIFASDVIYDIEIVPFFCKLLKDLFSLQKNNNFSIAYVACTIRNLDTINFFVKTLIKNNLKISKKFLCPANGNYFKVINLLPNFNNELNMIEFEPSFPLPSTLILETEIFEIQLEKK